MLRRFFVRSHRRELTSSRQPSRQSRRRLRSGAAISTFALIAGALGTATLPAPPAKAIYGNPAGGSGKYTQVIDWIDWTEMTNTLPGKGTRILPDGSTGVVWSTPSRISGDMWRTSRCTLSNVRTTAVGKNETGLPTDRGLSVGYYPGNWMGDGLARLYNDGTNYVVMDDKTFEQFELPAEKFGDAARFLLENMRVQVSFHEGDALFAELPISVDLKIDHTEPGLQGDRSSGGTKPATLETGAEIQVPLFLETGNVVKVDTRTGEYLSRVNN